MKNGGGFGERIRFLRLERNFTMEEFAEILDISVSHVGLLEREERKPSYSTLLKIIVSLGTSADYLLFGTAIDDKANPSSIFINEGEIEALKNDLEWSNFEKEYALGLAVSHSLKHYKLDEDKLSYIYAAVNYIAGKIR